MSFVHPSPTSIVAPFHIIHTQTYPTCGAYSFCPVRVIESVPVSECPDEEEEEEKKKKAGDNCC